MGSLNYLYFNEFGTILNFLNNPKSSSVESSLQHLFGSQQYSHIINNLNLTNKGNDVQISYWKLLGLGYMKTQHPVVRKTHFLMVQRLQVNANDFSNRTMWPEPSKCGRTRAPSETVLLQQSIPYTRSKLSLQLGFAILNIKISH